MSFDPNKNPGYVIGFAAVVSAVFTAAIMAVYVWAKPTIDRNERVLTERAIVEVFGLGPGDLPPDQTSALYEKHIVPPNEKTPYYFAFRDGQDRPFGVAVPVAGIGFWAEIRGLIAIDVETGRCLGLVFLSQSETPGLGARITEPAFRKQFVGKPIVSPGDKIEPVDFDAISGATNTSVAVKRFINEDLPKEIPAAMEAARHMTRPMNK